MARAYQHSIAIGRRLVELQPQSAGGDISDGRLLRSARPLRPEKRDFDRAFASISWMSAFLEHTPRIGYSGNDLRIYLRYRPLRTNRYQTRPTYWDTVARRLRMNWENKCLESIN